MLERMEPSGVGRPPLRHLAKSELFAIYKMHPDGSDATLVFQSTTDDANDPSVCC